MKAVVDTTGRRWLVGSKLSAAGSQAMVYTCRDGKSVIKVYRDNVYGEYERECECLAKVMKPKLLGRGRTKTGYEFIILERFACTLRDVLGSSEIDKIDICNQLATNLEAIHGAGIVHCDINTENVLVSADKSTIVLADFGRSNDYNLVHAWYDRYYMIVTILAVINGSVPSVEQARHLKQAIRDQTVDAYLAGYDKQSRDVVKRLVVA